MVKYVHFTVKFSHRKIECVFNYKNKKITITMENKNNFDLYDEENIEEEEEIETRCEIFLYLVLNYIQRKNSF